MLTTTVLASLPEDYKHFISGWKSVPEEKQTFYHLVVRLLLEEERKTKKEGVEKVSAFAWNKMIWLWKNWVLQEGVYSNAKNSRLLIIKRSQGTSK